MIGCFYKVSKVDFHPIKILNWHILCNNYKKKYCLLKLLTKHTISKRYKQNANMSDFCRNKEFIICYNNINHI